MVQGVGVSAGSTTLAALLLRPGLPGTPSDTEAPAHRVQDVSDPVAFSAEAQRRAERAKNTVAALETGGEPWSAAAFGWMLRQRVLDLLCADMGQAFGAMPGSASPAPTRGGAVDLAA